MKPPLLEQRMRLGQAFLIGRDAIPSGEAAFAHHLRLQGPLEEDHAVDRGFRLVSQQIWMMRSLRGPDLFELIFVMPAVGIEVIAIGFGSHSHALHILLVQEFAQRACARFRDCLIERLGAAGDLALLIVFADPVRLAVGLEPAPLIEVEQRPPDLMRGQLFIERADTQRIGVFTVQLLASRLVRGQQPVRNQHFDKCRTPPKVAIASPPHGPRITPIHRQAGPGFWVAAIGEYTHADIADRVAIKKAPTDRIRSDIKSELCGHPAFPSSAFAI